MKSIEIHLYFKVFVSLKSICIEIPFNVFDPMSGYHRANLNGIKNITPFLTVSNKLVTYYNVG